MGSTRKLAAALVLGLTVAITASNMLGQTVSERTMVTQLAQHTHFHGIAVDRQDSGLIYLATHHGFFAVSLDGIATRVSVTRDDFMGFTPHPQDPGILYASGHPQEGGNLGFIASTDGGKTWRQIAPGVGGPVDFHQMTVSPADPKTIFGAYGGVIQVSRDSGKAWEVAARSPDRLIDLATSAVNIRRLYAATQNGLLQSTDGGRTWTDAYSLKRPVTMVEVTPTGEIYAFVIGTGLIHAWEPGRSWQTLATNWGEDYLLHLAADPSNSQALYAVAGQRGIVASKDGGRTWREFGGSSER